MIKKLYLMFALSLCCINVEAYNFVVDGLYYNILSNNQVEVTYKKYQDHGYSGALVIPERVKYGGKEYVVSSIGRYAFFECKNITGTLAIPNTVTTIGEQAFKGCSGIKGSLIIPNSVTSIGKEAFRGCGFDGTLTISNSLSAIEEAVFFACEGFTGSLIIPGNITSIGRSAFGGCGFTGSLTIPNFVKSIGDYAFVACEGFDGTLTISNSITTIGESVFERCKGFTGSLIIPNNVTSIGHYAFRFCSGFTGSLTIPNSVTSIGRFAFGECEGFDGVLTIPNSITTIEKGVFQGCKGFTGPLIIPNTITSIGDYAFRGCGGFNGALTIPNSLLTIGEYAFSDCSSLTGSLTIPNSVTTIGRDAFSKCEGFNGTLEIPNSITTISKSAFYGCSGFVGLLMPSSVTSIKENAFESCSKLSYVVSEIQHPFEINENVFEGISSGAKLQVPQGTKSAYFAYSGWTINFKEIVEFSDSPTTYNLSIKATGNGSASYDGTTIRSKTSTFTVNVGTNATITFSPDNGYRIKTVKVNNSAVSVSNNQYTVSSISKDTSVEVEFEAIPPTTYTLSIKAIGNGSASYDGTTIRSKTSTFTVVEGTNATITFTPDNGYRIKTVRVNNSAVSVINKYTVNNFDMDTYIEVEFEAITHTLTIKATGNGSASYDGTTIRSKTSTFTVNEGTNATITFSPDNGYRIKTVKVNNSAVSVSNNQYTVSSISKDTSVEVEFEAIPPTTYTLSIKATGSGSAIYDGTTIRSKTSSFTVNEGTNATITFTPDNGYRIKVVKVNNSAVSVSNNQYTVSSISKDTSVEVEFEAIPPTTFTLSIKATGNGSASYDGTTIRGKTSTFTVNEGTNATITFTPDNGYRIKTVKVNSSAVSVSNNQYTVSNITKDTSVEVEFEAITYTLSIKAIGNGSASYNGTTIREETKSFTLVENSSATITFYPDNGYKIKSVKRMNTDVTSSVSNNQYTISRITIDTTIEVEFEAIPPTTYTLSIKAIGNGSASYDGTTIRSKTSTFTVNEGTNATITFSPDNGYRIKTVKVNSTAVSVSNNQYTVSNISKNTSVEVEFEAIPPTTYTLSIKAIGNGSASYDGTTIRSKTSTFTVNEGTNATIAFSPDNGYRIKVVKVNSSAVSVSNNQYTVSNISKDISVEVEFEAIPPTTYTLSIKATGNGSASYDGTTIRSNTSSFTVVEGSSATITFTPDNGYHIKTVKVNSTAVSVSNNQYTISNISKDTTVEVEFEEDVKAFTSNGVSYSVVSYDTKTVNVASADYGVVLEVPEKVTYQDVEWKVIGIEKGALGNSAELAAIVWNPQATFTESVNNPNLLLYVQSANYAPASIKNVVVNSVAEKITLMDASQGNNFYCPQEFTAREISYSHHYLMTTGIGESRGWETIALPFDVQKMTHSNKGEITPIINWKSGDEKKPFWLMEFGSSGWKKVNSIKANTPYIISMPNNPYYGEEFHLNGSVTFSAENAIVKRSDEVQSAAYGGMAFVPNFTRQTNTEYYALNVNNDYVTYNGGATEGSRFVINLRELYPFEAYMTATASVRQYFEISEGMTTGIFEIENLELEIDKYYDLQGRRVEHPVKGLYIKNGKKLINKKR